MVLNWVSLIRRESYRTDCDAKPWTGFAKIFTVWEEKTANPEQFTAGRLVTGYYRDEFGRTQGSASPNFDIIIDVPEWEIPCQDGTGITDWDGIGDDCWLRLESLQNSRAKGRFGGKFFAVPRSERVADQLPGRTFWRI